MLLISGLDVQAWNIIYFKVYLYQEVWVSQIAIYLDRKLEEKMTRAARREGKSRSAWVQEAILMKIGSGLPDSWFDLWGSWEDKKSTKKILADIDAGYAERERSPLK